MRPRVYSGGRLLLAASAGRTCRHFTRSLVAVVSDMLVCVVDIMFSFVLVNATTIVLEHVDQEIHS